MLQSETVPEKADTFASELLIHTMLNLTVDVIKYQELLTSHRPIPIKQLKFRELFTGNEQGYYQ